MNGSQSFLALIPGQGEGGEGSIRMGGPAYFPLPNQPFINGRSLREDLLVIVDRRELCNVNHPAYYAPTYLYLQIDSLLNHNQPSESRLAKNVVIKSRDGIRRGPLGAERGEGSSAARVPRRGSRLPSVPPPGAAAHLRRRPVPRAAAVAAEEEPGGPGPGGHGGSGRAGRDPPGDCPAHACGHCSPA